MKKNAISSKSIFLPYTHINRIWSLYCQSSASFVLFTSWWSGPLTVDSQTHSVIMRRRHPRSSDRYNTTRPVIPLGESWIFSPHDYGVYVSALITVTRPSNCTPHRPPYYHEARISLISWPVQRHLACYSAQAIIDIFAPWFIAWSCTCTVGPLHSYCSTK